MESPHSAETQSQVGAHTPRKLARRDDASLGRPAGASLAAGLNSPGSGRQCPLPWRAESWPRPQGCSWRRGAGRCSQTARRARGLSGTGSSCVRPQRQKQHTGCRRCSHSATLGPRRSDLAPFVAPLARFPRWAALTLSRESWTENPEFSARSTSTRLLSQTAMANRTRKA